MFPIASAPIIGLQSQSLPGSHIWAGFWPTDGQRLHEGLSRKSFVWACGPPIDMKIKSSRNVYDQGAWNGKDRGNPGLSEAV